MGSLTDHALSLARVPQLAKKFELLAAHAAFAEVQFIFFNKKTLVKSLGGQSLLRSLDPTTVAPLPQIIGTNTSFFKAFKPAKSAKTKPHAYVLPLLFNAAPVGCLVFPFEKENNAAFGALQVFKHQVESLLQLKALENKLRQSNKELSYRMLEIESLFDVTEIINAPESELQTLFDHLLITVLSTLNASKGMILLKDAKTGFFNTMSNFNLSKEELPSKILRSTKGILKQLEAEQLACIVDTPQEHSLLHFVQKNALISPLVNQNELVGAVVLADKESRAGLVRFIQQDLRLFDNLTKKMSLAYDNLRLIDSLKNSNKLVDNIMTSITTGIIKINMLGEIEYVNQAAKAVFKFDEDMVLNNHYFIVFEQSPELLQLLEAAETQENSRLQEENVKVNDFLGGAHEINLTISTVMDENNAPSGFVFSFEDLSDINKVKSTFKKYVSENIVDELLKNDMSLELGGTQNDVCVLFCDIRGFTAMSEKMKPSDVVYLLNHYFDAMIEVVFEHNGTLDKIIGDELMVLYGVPLPTENDAQSAVDSAIAMFKALEAFNVRMAKENYPELKIGIGINYGKVVCGNIGSERQMNYTVIGDHVNLAARLCSHAKPGEIVISEAVFKQLNCQDHFIEHPPIKVKGKSQPIPNWVLSATD